MKVVIPGGSGQVGLVLARAFQKDGHEVVVLSRNPQAAPWRTAYWDGCSSGSWVAALEGADVVINLAGKTVNCRYNAKNREAIMTSRIQSTEAVGHALQKLKNPPGLWLQAGTATIYAHRFDKPNDDYSGLIGGNEPDAPDTWAFSIAVAQAWEAAVSRFELPHTRKVIMRAAVVMSPDKGGVFHVLSSLVKAGLGGPAGNGQQYVSWIHEQDFIRAVHYLIANPNLSGPINLCSPNPLPNKAFMSALRKAWGMPAGLPASRWMLEVGAVFMRTESELILKSRRVVPSRLMDSGFSFAWPDWPNAALELRNRAESGVQDPVQELESASSGRP